MDKIYKVYLVSDSTGETLDRIFLALQAQFLNFKYKSHQYAFTRTKNQIIKILEICKKKKNSIILYTIVDVKLANLLVAKSEKINIPCFGVLGDLILRFSKNSILFLVWSVATPWYLMPTAIFSVEF